VVVHDALRRPFPEIPFPDDLATVLDPGSPTGRRLNLSTTGDVRHERLVRSQLNSLDGFGTYQPLWVAFDRPLDVGNIVRRHQENLDPGDDVAYVINIDPGSPRYGERVPLDMGRGNFPALQRPDTFYYPSDPRQGTPSLLFETVDEDRNGNGVLDPGEDGDNDGVLDEPNVWPPDAAAPDGLLTFYERESRTLLLRPIVPLEEQSEYAVVLTRRLTGLNGEPVRSPFPYVHHRVHQTRLQRLRNIFADWRATGVPMSVDDVAFAWVFTTQTVTADLVAIREGLYGYGPLAWLEDRFPADCTPLPAMSREVPGSPYVLKGGLLKLLSAVVLGPAFDVTQAQIGGLLEDLDHVDYLVQGSFSSPDFLTDDRQEDLYDMTFDLDLGRGTARVRPERILFTMTVPRATEQFRPPFPVAIYAHGFGMARVEFLGFAGILARYGIACAGIDAWGHGIYIPAEFTDLLEIATGILGIEPFMEAFLRGRARDLTGDGKSDAGGDTFSAYGFHTRDALRQTVADHLQLVRMFKQFDGRRGWDLDQNGDGENDTAGDFNGDGVVDAGGPDNPYFQWGSSMGGIHSTIIGAVEPSIVATAPVAGGAGLSSLSSRSAQASVRADVVMRAVGPVVVGEPAEGSPDTIRLSILFPLARKLRQMPFAEVRGVRPGCRVELVNLDQGMSCQGEVQEGLRFSLPMKSDREDRFAVSIYDAQGARVDHIETWRMDAWYRMEASPDYRAGDPLRSPGEGWGLHRGSPDLRRLVGLAQLIMDPGDPINYAPHYFLDPLEIRPEGKTPSDLLVVATLGDPYDPVDTHAAKARGAGILEYRVPDPAYGQTLNDWLIGKWVLEGVPGFGRFPPTWNGQEVLFDPDSLDHLGKGGDNGFQAPDPRSLGLPELRLKVSTPSGESGITFAHMEPQGSHSFFVTDPSRPFNADEYLASLVGYWFATGGDRIHHHGCHEDSSCQLP